jgi:hypothetical protein
MGRVERRTILPLFVFLMVSACGEVGNLAVSAGAPVAAAVRGVITICTQPVFMPELRLRVEQDRPEQAQPVDARIGPFTGNRDGSYLVEVGPAFAVPGPASVQLEMTSATGLDTIAQGTLSFTLGTPARDTLRLDADLGIQHGSCRVG